MIGKDDIVGFFFDRKRDRPEDYLTLKFLFETSEDPRWVAANLCSEQSTAQWKIPGESLDLRPRYAAKVISVRVLEESATPLYPLPSTQGQTRFLRCEAIIAHPHENFGPRLSNLIAAVAGEGIFYAPGIHTIQLRDVTFPNAYLEKFEGPQFGVSGVRKLLGVEGRPLFFGVVKPNLGLTPDRFGDLAEQAWLGSLDIAKDDEMQADAPWSPLEKRIRYAGEARRRAERKTGRSKVFVANVTDEMAAIPKLARTAIAGGANALMVNPMMTGFSAIRALRCGVEVPLMGHFAGIAAWGRLPYFGVHSVVATKLMRLAGADIVVIAGFGSRMQSSEEEVLENVRACLDPMGPMTAALPVPGGSDWAGTLPLVYEKVGHADFGFISGRGVFGHPQGPRAGAASLVQAWEAIRSGRTLEEASRSAPELAAAMAAFSEVKPVPEPAYARVVPLRQRS